MFKKIIIDLFNSIDISFKDIQVKNDNFYRDLLTGYPSLVIGEAYMNEDIIIPDLYSTMKKLYRLSDSNWYNILGWRIIFLIFFFIKMVYSKVRFYFFNHRGNNVKHYNFSNKFYQTMLGRTMQYSCGYFLPCSSLNEAQDNKINVIIHKLKLKDKNNVLEIGSGYGYLSKRIVEYNVNVTGINICDEQLNYSRNLSSKVNFIKMDYKDLEGSYDRIVSVGMFEHVGKKNYKEFFKKVDNCLEDNGIFLLHTITSKRRSIDPNDPFLDKYIFPGGMIPNLIDILEATEDTDLKCEHVEDFGFDYTETLKRWYNNIEKEKNKMFEYYLTICRIAFEERDLSLKQIIFTKNYREVYRI